MSRVRLVLSKQTVNDEDVDGGGREKERESTFSDFRDVGDVCNFGAFPKKETQAVVSRTVDDREGCESCEGVRVFVCMCVYVCVCVQGERT